jgi:hypothetical protein
MKTAEKMSNYENLDGLTNPINSEGRISKEEIELIHPGKMMCLKQIILNTYLTEKEHFKRRDCEFEFTVKNGTITLLEIWYNPRGAHKYKEKYREEFEVNLPIEIVYKENSIDSPVSKMINKIIDVIDTMNQG